jgi:hypothetical protein
MFSYNVFLITQISSNLSFFSLIEMQHHKLIHETQPSILSILNHWSKIIVDHVLRKQDYHWSCFPGLIAFSLAAITNARGERALGMYAPEVAGRRRIHIMSWAVHHALMIAAQ